VSDIDLRNIAKLARLSLTDKELKVLAPQVSDILDFVDKLKKIDVAGVEPTSHPLSLKNIFRQDQVTPSIPTEAFLKKSPRSRGHFFEVPKVVEDKPR
jgi:aspartyl-tRNA(Asn)/glutamyl-tRNA(Gln) amidotransferase subunit C